MIAPKLFADARSSLVGPTLEDNIHSIPEPSKFANGNLFLGESSGNPAFITESSFFLKTFRWKFFLNSLANLTGSAQSCRFRYAKLPQQMECIRKSRRKRPAPKTPTGGKPLTPRQRCALRHSKLPQIQECVRKSRLPKRPRPQQSSSRPKKSNHKSGACRFKPWLLNCH